MANKGEIMKEEFGGKIIIENKHQPAFFQLDLENKTLTIESMSLWKAAIFGGGILSYLPSKTIDKATKRKIFQVNLSKLQNAEFCKYGLTSKAIKLTLNEGEINLMCERPKKMLELFKSLIN